jgi:hypothetical protein
LEKEELDLLVLQNCKVVLGGERERVMVVVIWRVKRRRCYGNLKFNMLETREPQVCNHKTWDMFLTLSIWGSMQLCMKLDPPKLNQVCH